MRKMESIETNETVRIANAPIRKSIFSYKSICQNTQTKIDRLPQIFNGASSSSRIGWLRKISLDLLHKLLISFSVNCTFLPGLDPRTEEGRGFFWFVSLARNEHCLINSQSMMDRLVRKHQRCAKQKKRDRPSSSRDMMESMFNIS